MKDWGVGQKQHRAALNGAKPFPPGSLSYEAKRLKPLEKWQGNPLPPLRAQVKIPCGWKNCRTASILRGEAGDSLDPGSLTDDKLRSTIAE